MNIEILIPTMSFCCGICLYTFLTNGNIQDAANTSTLPIILGVMLSVVVEL